MPSLIIHEHTDLIPGGFILPLAAEFVQQMRSYWDGFVSGRRFGGPRR